MNHNRANYSLLNRRLTPAQKTEVSAFMRRLATPRNWHFWDDPTVRRRAPVLIGAGGLALLLSGPWVHLFWAGVYLGSMAAIIRR